MGYVGVDVAEDVNVGDGVREDDGDAVLEGERERDRDRDRVW